MKKIKVLIIGAGNRGNQYASYSKYFPEEMEVVGVAEPNPARREAFVKEYDLKSNIYHTWQEAFTQEKFADAAIICTTDRDHFRPFVAAEKRGYHILLEKPIATNIKDCKKIAAISEESEQVTAICHVLRYSPYFIKIKEIVSSGALGEIACINHLEAIGHKHFAHSYVRGNWRKKGESGPLTLTKSCHDFDILNWLADSRCTKIGSFADLTHFKKEKAPAGSSDRCIDCSVKNDCPYNAEQIYSNFNFSEWPTSVITDEPTPEGLLKALKNGPYGKCVYRSDNNVVDHQSTILKYKNQITASLTISAFTDGDIVGKRFTRVMGSRGELWGDFESINVTDFVTGKKETINIEIKETDIRGHHGGGDFGLVRDFLSSVNGQEGISRIEDGLAGHIQAFAADRSRKTGKMVRLF
jgi:predicted dehydrogenase